MNKRVGILLALVAAVLLYRGEAVYEIFFSPPSPSGTGFDLKAENGYLTVTAVKEKDQAGRPTSGFQAGLRPKDKILAVYNARGQGGPVRGWFDYSSVKKTVKPDEPWTLVVARTGDRGQPEELRLTLPPVPYRPMSIGDRLVLLLVFVVLPLLAIITACLIGFMKPEDNNAFLASLLFLSFSSIFEINYASFPPGLRVLALVVHTTLNSFVVYLFMRFFLLFPSPSLIERKAPWIKQIGLAITAAGWLPNLIIVYAYYTSLERYARFDRALSKYGRVAGWLTLAMFIIGLLSLILNTVKAASKDEKRRMIILLAGTVVSLLPIMALITYRKATGMTGPPPFWLIGILITTLGIFPLSFVYVVVKHRVLGIRVILRRGLQYMLVMRGFLIVEAVAIFFLLYFASQSLFARFFSQAGAGTIIAYTALVTLGVAAVLHRVNRPIMHAIDRRFFREAYNTQQVLTELSRAVRRLVVQPGSLLNVVTDKIGESLHPDQVAVFLRGTEAKYLPSEDHQFGTALVHLTGRAADRYHCCALRLRSGRHDIPYPIETYDEWTLAGDAFVARYLERFTTEEPEALEVYLDDPKSWASALARVDSQADSRYRERLLLERLNTRLIVPLMTNNRLLGFISLGEKLSEEPYNKNDKQLLLTVAQQAAIALDYAQLIRQVAEQEKLKREIEIAKEVQAQLFPQTLPSLRTLNYTGVCQAARGVGGDYYDFLLIGADKLGVALGDISGKGISAALLMASLQAMLRSHAPARADRVDELIEDINRLMYASTDPSKYATFFYGFYDDSRRTLTYVNAGHNPPMLFRSRAVVPASSPAPRPAACEMMRLETGGTVVGLLPNAAYQHDTVQLRPGDLLVIFTDGISEAMNSQEEEFGEERLGRVIAEHMHLPVVALRDLILSQIAEFVGEAPQHDDMTLVVAKVQ